MTRAFVLSLFPDEVTSIAAVLNRDHYRFKQPEQMHARVSPDEFTLKIKYIRFY
jgi:hypothetical protein